MKKKAIIFGAILLAAAVLFSIKYNTMLLDSRASAKVISPTYSYEVDYADKRKLAASADNIFVGEVLEEKGQSERHGNPATLYEVRVTHNVKGALLGGLTIIQEGGYYKENGRLHLLQYEGDQLLKKGEVYLFTAIKEEENFWIMPVYGHELLKTEEQKFARIAEIEELLGE